jgi:hypothetical protein
MLGSHRILAAVKIALLCGSLVIALSLPAQISHPELVAPMVSSFDVPLKKRIVDYGPSPYYDPARRVRVKLSCFYFPTFMIKEYDEGQKGAEWLAILPVRKETVPKCHRSHEKEEKVIEGAEWGGYFRGVKSNLVFFDAADGYDGGLPFVIYDSVSGKKLFEDSAYDSNMWNKKAKDSPFNQLRVSSTKSRPISITYLRVVEAGCDLHTEKMTCWDSVKASLELKSAQMPICSGYENISDRFVSVIAYPIEVSLSQQPVVKSVAGPTKCWPAD